MITKFNNLTSSRNSLVRKDGVAYYCNRHLVRFVHYKKKNLLPVMKKVSIGPNPISCSSWSKHISNKNSTRNMGSVNNNFSSKEFIMQRSIFDNVVVTALIENLRVRQDAGENLFETDYSLILAAILPHYFKFENNNIITPEMWSNDKRRSDFVASRVNIFRNGTMPYGHATPLLMVECKKRWAISWQSLAKDQLWDQADSLKNSNDKLWVIGQIGFDICFFKYDVSNYLGSDWFTNFSPLNLNNFTQEDLDILEIEYIVESLGSTDVIQVIRWRLDKPDHHRYIHDMLNYISTTNP